MRRRLSVLVLAVMLTLFVGGCKSKKSLDADVDHLIVAVSSSDYEHFKADADPALVTEVSQQEFEAMSRVLKKLGPLKKKTMKRIEVTQGLATGAYEMEFASGRCDLEIKSRAGKVVSFHFTGEDIRKLTAAP